MGVPYNAAIDMWSFGCILAEMDTGRALFPAHDELELLERMRVTVGNPPAHMVRNKAASFYLR
jgi:dual specificity tyrosine-phosphorylation-regulated kinase 2/3/4